MQRSLINLSVIAGLLSGCGGGSSDASAPISEPVAQEPPASATTTVKSGVITGFGSVYVDGERYTTDETSITINGEAGASIESLKVGMRIALTSSDSGSTPGAATITYESDVEGVIQTIDRLSGRIQIAGVTISYDDLTHFIATSENTLSVGDRIEVSGYALADGTFYATYIEIENELQPSQSQTVSGVVSELDTTAQQFYIGSTLVDYSQASAEGALANGLQVKVEGLFSDGVLTAAELKVRVVSYEDNDDVAEAEIEGVLTAVDPASNTLELYGQTYTYTSSTAFEDGTVDDLLAGAIVEIEVAYANGEQTVTKVEFKKQNLADGKVKGVITAIDTEAGSITVNNSVYVVNNQTRYEDDDDQYVALSFLQVNDKVELVYQTVDETNIVLRLERENDEEYFAESELEGYVTAVTGNSITLLGLTIDLAAEALYLLDERRVTLDIFVAQLSIPAKVELRGNYDQNGVFIANRFELELEDDSDDDGDNDDDRSDDDDSDGQSKNGVYLEIEGRVTAVTGDGRFTLNGYDVDVNTASKLELNDLKVSVIEFMAAISDGTVVEVEGVLDAEGVLVATEAEIEEDDSESDDD
ncbi:DUF5666 domain-containing protein [Alteromonas lipolytica]|uniref:DUF5666 domain-containing protein n=1 Tax=Alteromonas lipolytica TaxID=1856405 RepID=A0A1E8FI61_9ALTE|nr:DUF5666 domain-containing protein [Alteromonas lipolytica]OFI35584.1 hypothetical protein BFC17_12555 [Alteromonas lipolytica]GGF77385.1 hypothetical protein GCM10011338_32130 [Alteromonas lipolytica]